MSKSKPRSQKPKPKEAATKPAPARFPKPTVEQSIAAGELARTLVSIYESHAYSLSPLIDKRFRGKGITLPSLSDRNWRQDFLAMIDSALNPKDLTVWIDKLSGRYVASMADEMVAATDGTATLHELAHELQFGLVGVRSLIETFGEDAPLITPIDPD